MKVSDLIYHLKAFKTTHCRIRAFCVVSNYGVLGVEHGQVRVLWALGSHGLSSDVTISLNAFELSWVAGSKVAVNRLSIPQIHDLGRCQFHNGRVADLGTLRDVIVKMWRKFVWFEVSFLITNCSFGVLETISRQWARVYWRVAELWAVWVGCRSSLVILVKHWVGRDTLLDLVALAWHDAASYIFQCSFPLYLLVSFDGQARSRFNSLYFGGSTLLLLFGNSVCVEFSMETFWSEVGL